MEEKKSRFFMIFPDGTVSALGEQSRAQAIAEAERLKSQHPRLQLTRASEPGQPGGPIDLPAQ